MVGNGIRGALLIASLAVLSSGCSRIVTDPGMETVLFDKPYLLGHGGVREETQKTGAGWFWWSTEGITVPVTPFKVDEAFDDLTTSNNNFLDYNSYLTMQITEPSLLLSKFGPKWYESNLKEQYRTIVRDEVKKYPMEKLLTDPEISGTLEKSIRVSLNKVIKDTAIPVKLVDFSLGRAKPNQPVVDEMNATAQQQQRKKTMVEAAAAEVQRKEAEMKRADADKAYQDKMGLSTEMLVQLESVKRFSEACKVQGSTCVISVGGGNGMVVSPRSGK